jgi:DUF1680 family protein
MIEDLELEKGQRLNQLFGAQRCDGSAWGYYAQMEGKKPYSSTLEGHCCLSSGPRGVALIPTFAVSTDAAGVVVNLYDAGTAKLSLKDNTPVRLVTETRYPAEEQIRMTVGLACTSGAQGGKEDPQGRRLVPTNWWESAAAKGSLKPIPLLERVDG